MKAFLSRSMAASTAALLLLAGAARADLPKPDDFQGNALDTSVWSFKEIGSDATDSMVTVNNGQLHLFGAGKDIFDETYQFFYVYQKNITGDFSLRLRIDSVPDLNKYSGVGLLITQIDDTSDDTTKLPAYYLIHGTRDTGVEMKGGGVGRTRCDHIMEGIKTPYWVRLDKVGQQVIGYLSTDEEKTWTLVREDTFHSGGPFEGDIQIGSEPPLQEPFVVGIHEQTHSGSTSGDAAVKHFQVVPLDTGTISGSVTDDTGKPAGGVWVVAQNADNVFWTKTADDGTYAFKALAGAYTLTTDTAAMTGDSQPVTVSKDGTTPANLTAHAIPFAEGTAADSHDDAFAGTALDPKWQSADVGAMMAGSQSVGGGAVTIMGDGAGVGQFEGGAPASQFHYLYQPISRDFSATVKVTANASNRGTARSGLFLRNDTDPGSPEALAALTGDGNTAFRWRRVPTASGDTDEWDLADLSAPGYVKLRRRGPFIAAWYSADGVQGQYITQAYVPGLKPNALIGLGVTSGDDSNLDSASFTSFKVVPIAGSSASVKGDLNGDGKVDIKDATLSLQIAVGSLTATDAQKTAGDVNGDGSLDIKDTTLILSAAVGIRSL